MMSRSFGYQWTETSQDFEVSHVNPEFEKKIVYVFVNDVELPRELYKGKKCLDAGCGIGRWSYAPKKLGVDVTTFDVTESGVEVTKRTVKDVRVLKADIFDMPFKEKF